MYISPSRVNTQLEFTTFDTELRNSVARQVVMLYQQTKNTSHWNDSFNLDEYKKFRGETYKAVEEDILNDLVEENQLFRANMGEYGIRTRFITFLSPYVK